MDFNLESNPPLTIDFPSGATRMPVPFNISEDVIEEGFEDFTFVLSYDGDDPYDTVRIVTRSATVNIKDNDGRQNRDIS